MKRAFIRRRRRLIDVTNIDAIVIGGSAGAFAALKVLLPALPDTLNVPVVIVVHLPPDRPSAIAEIFSQDGRRRVKEADDKEPLDAGTVYFAPPGTTCSSNQIIRFRWPPTSPSIFRGHRLTCCSSRPRTCLANVCSP